MSTYAELNCFNDLLVKAMKRAEARHRAELNALRSKYESLVALTDEHDTPQCSVCEHWFEDTGGGVVTQISEDDTNYTCEACMAKPDCPVAQCIRCDDGIDTRTGEARFHSWQPGAEDDCYCKGCFKYQLMEQQVGLNGAAIQAPHHELIGDAVYIVDPYAERRALYGKIGTFYNRHRELMEELKNCKNWVL
jgi:hypothetical protein